MSTSPAPFPSHLRRIFDCVAESLNHNQNILYNF